MAKDPVKKNESSVGQVQSLTRGLKLLEKISESRAGLSLTDLGLQVGLPNSTVHRLLMTMQQEGFINQAPDSGLWYIGSKAFTVGSAFVRSRDLMEIAYPIMKELMEKVGETVNLLVYNEVGKQAILIGQIQCNELMRMVASLGDNLPLHASGGGKIFLSSLPEKEAKSIIQKTGLPRYTEFTIDTQNGLFDELKQIQKQGYSCDLEEHAYGLNCIAAPVYDENHQVIAALSISGPKTRIYNEQIVHLSSIVMQYASKITEEFSGKSV